MANVSFGDLWVLCYWFGFRVVWDVSLLFRVVLEVHVFLALDSWNAVPFG